jgi:NAD(P)-dependent dehydrogenase (short-subunit alcohol dehydrogenase family)
MSDRITSRFDAFTPASDVVEGIDLAGKRAIVTGGASGIGVETARALAKAGAKVTLAVRNKTAGEAAAADINASVGAERTDVGVLDLADQATVRAFADAWGKTPLHILINNAGVMACPQTYTADDLEMQIGANHFGHYTLAAGLASALEAGAAEQGRPARVVALSSTGHFRSPVVFEDPHFRHRPYDKWAAYGQSKTANALFAVGFNARMKDRGVNANSVMPGGIMTPLQRHLPREEMIAFGWIDEAGKIADGFKTTEQGASTSVWGAVGPELEGVGGLYLENCAEAAPFGAAKGRQGVMAYALDSDAAERLWALSVETTGADI